MSRIQQPEASATFWCLFGFKVYPCLFHLSHLVTGCSNKPLCTWPFTNIVALIAVALRVSQVAQSRRWQFVHSTMSQSRTAMNNLNINDNSSNNDNNSYNNDYDYATPERAAGASAPRVAFLEPGIRP